jgi:hypothetical protein
MTLELVDAMSMRDGGTTYVALQDPSHGVVTYTFDYSLPWDRRARHITRAVGGTATVLPVSSAEEREAFQQVRMLLVGQFGEQAVAAFEHGLTENLGVGHWFYVFNFLALCVKEGKVSV